MQLLMDTVLGLVEKIMAATIEYSYVCIQNKNAPHAIRVLEEALELLEVMIIKFFLVVLKTEALPTIAST